MAEYSEPYDGGAAMAEEGWTEMWSTVQSPGINPEVTNTLQVYTTLDGRQVRVRSGVAYIKGHRYRSDATITITLPANTGAMTRKDMVTLRFNRLEKTTNVVLLRGADNGALPVLATSHEVYDLPLARLELPPNYTSVTDDMIFDLRQAASSNVNKFAMRLMMPAGMVIPWAGASLPGGMYAGEFLFAEGQTVSGDIYPQYVANCGTRLPDLRGRVMAGVDANHPILGTGGARSKTIAVSHLPPHNHGVNDPGHTHSVNDDFGLRVMSTAAAGTQYISDTGVQNVSATAIQSNTTGITTQNTGSGSAFNVEQPWTGVNYLVKVH